MEKTDDLTFYTRFFTEIFMFFINFSQASHYQKFKKKKKMY